MSQKARNNYKSHLCRMALRCIDIIVDSDPDGPAVFRVRNWKYIDSSYGLDMVGVGVDFCDGSTVDFFLLRKHLPTITALCNALNIKQK